MVKETDDRLVRKTYSRAFTRRGGWGPALLVSGRQCQS